MDDHSPNDRPEGWIQELMDPAAWPHQVESLRLIETHISWVILTGRFAYKIKKPVSLGFLDFSTAELRRFYCEEELRLNRRTAPDLYLQVVPVGRVEGQWRVGAEPAREHALRMRQFPDDARLDRCLAQGRLRPSQMRQLATMLVRFHNGLPSRGSDDPESEAKRASKPAFNNFRHLRNAEIGDRMAGRLAGLERWTREQAEELDGAFSGRAKQGFVRECHGDLHLANLLLLEGRFLAFDCIEFDEDLRWIDTANDIAFLVMDLAAREREDLAFAVLGAWLEGNGDYAALEVMRFYLVFRALVRAVVAAVRREQQRESGPASADEKLGRQIDLAAAFASPPRPRLVLMHGLSGSGKTWLSERLLAALPAVRVRSDLERKRLRRDGCIEAELYGEAATTRTYARLLEHCETGLRAGFSMIADATFLGEGRRRRFRELAQDLEIPAVIVDCTADRATLRSRIGRRAAEQSDASDADVAVLEHQLEAYRGLNEEERRIAIAVETAEIDEASIRSLADEIRRA